MKRSHQKNMDTTPNAKSFSLSLLSHNPHSNAAIKVLTDAWGEYVSEVGKDDFHIRADLTFRRGMMVNVAASAATPSVRYYKSISEDIAYQTISSFMNRMNYHAYKNAYKRYGKKLRVLSAVEGGKKDLRENTKSSDDDKNLHAHILLEKPAHMSFQQMHDAIVKHWCVLPWCDVVNQIEPLQTLRGSAGYNAKSSTDSIDLRNTHL